MSWLAGAQSLGLRISELDLVHMVRPFDLFGKVVPDKFRDLPCDLYEFPRLLFSDGRDTKCGNTSMGKTISSFPERLVRFPQAVVRGQRL